MSKNDQQKESVMDNTSSATISIEKEAMMEEKGKEERNGERGRR
jgi:hypothetical protein